MPESGKLEAAGGGIVLRSWMRDGDFKGGMDVDGECLRQMAWGGERSSEGAVIAAWGKIGHMVIGWEMNVLGLIA